VKDLIKMNDLDFLIHDCLREYDDVYIPSVIDTSITHSAKRDKSIGVPLLLEQNFNYPNYVSRVSPAITMPSIQKDNLAEVTEVPFVFPKHSVFCFKSMEMVTLVSPAESPMEGPKNRFSCLECNLSYSGKPMLKRHQQKHNHPNKHKCTIMECGQIDYSLSLGGGQIVHRRNLGVRTKAITPQMAKDGSKRKQKIMKEENASCMTCHHEIATLILHGTVEAIDTRYQVAMNCVDCETKYRLKTADIPRRTTSVDCDCCRRKVAVGGAKVQSMDDPSKWVDPSFGVEVVCVSCRDKYGFCTEVCVLIF
jgi:Zn finger protein HypA/HybF involved in hydrogenase expression